MISSKKTMLMEHLVCSICLDIIQHPRMCSSCSKIFCFYCLEKSLSSSRRCPVCRAHARSINNFPKCCWAQQLASDISSSETMEMCTTHKDEHMSLYCHECSKVICSHCVLFGDEHGEHEISPYKEVIKNHIEKADGIKLDIDTRVSKLHQCQSILGKYIHKFDGAKDHNLHVHVKDVSETATLICDGKKQKVYMFAEQLENELINLSEAVDDILQICNGGASIELMSKLDDAIAATSHALKHADETIDEFGSITELLDTALIVPVLSFSPEYKTETIIIYDFQDNCLNNRVVHSQPVTFCNLSFKLQVHIGLKTNNHSDTFLGAFLVATKPELLVSEYTFRICVTVVNQYGNEQAHKRSEFVTHFGPKHLEKIEVPNLKIKTNRLETMGLLAKDTDCVVLRFAMKPLSYAILSKMQEDYIISLENQRGLGLKQTSIPSITSPSPETAESSSLFSRAVSAMSQLQFASPTV